ncbi:hypothetical protein [Shouchella clausii]|uniref:hypothetical protein n=1 Tax=Shouchella clausii TaxID=79880 RepID=UPI000797A8CA|nr:hypothetical protein [Shouchella clausii]KKI86580.1 hypothetical protein WZ76_09075 [Shouchella clausii]
MTTVIVVIGVLATIKGIIEMNQNAYLNLKTDEYSQRSGYFKCKTEESENRFKFNITIIMPI